MAALIPASTLFGEKEIKLYLRWQLQQPSILQDRYHTLPTAFEYEDYLYWKNHLRSRYLPSVPGVNFINLDDVLENTGREEKKEWEGYMLTSKCKHPLHPAHPAVFATVDEEAEDGEVNGPVLRCPVCTIRAHLALLRALEDKWADVGGPWRNWDTASELNCLKYNLGNRAYHRVKLDMVNTIAELEDWAKAEATWEAEHTSQNIDAVKQYSATAALQIFWQEMRYPAHLLPSCVPSTPKKDIGRVKKRLSFTPDTPEKTRGRPLTLYLRSQPIYDPDSPHSCPDEDGWTDTSFMRDHLYAISQCRILLMVHDPLAPCISYTDLNSGPDRGDNKHVQRLQELVTWWLGQTDEANRRLHAQAIASASGIFLVHKNDWSPGEDFDMFTQVDTLVGTLVDKYARLVGDIDEEEFPREVTEEGPELFTESGGEESVMEEDGYTYGSEAEVDEALSDEDDFAVEEEPIADVVDVESSGVDVGETSAVDSPMADSDDAGEAEQWVDPVSEK